MSTRFVDIHSHVSFKEFERDREKVLSRMRDADVSTITVGVDLESSRRAVELAKLSPGVWAAVGLHPADNATEGFDPTEFGVLVSESKVVAIGECGLDFYRRDGVDEQERARQERELRRQIDFALKHDKPLMVHCRSAHEEMLCLLGEYKKEAGDGLRGNIHFFTSSAVIAKRYNELGFTVSFPGVITFARDYDAAIREVPLSMIMAETDAPFAAPLPHRGKRNEPSFVVETVKKIAELRGEPLQSVSTTLRENVARVFGF